MMPKEKNSTISTYVWLLIENICLSSTNQG